MGRVSQHRLTWQIAIQVLLAGPATGKSTAQKVPADLGFVWLGEIEDSNPADGKNTGVLLLKIIKTLEIKAVAEGNELLNGWILLQVNSNQLRIRDTKSGQEVAVTRNKLGVVTPEPAQGDAVAPAVTYGGQVKEDGFERDGGKVIATQAYVNDILQNRLGETLNHASAVPITEDGRLKFILGDIAEGSIFEKLGIQQDDKVTAVNGQAFDSVPGTIKMLQQLRQNSAGVEVTIERLGTELTLSVQVQ